jgi:hypothetical protein
MFFLIFFILRGIHLERFRLSRAKIRLTFGAFLFKYPTVKSAVASCNIQKPKHE